MSKKEKFKAELKALLEKYCATIQSDYRMSGSLPQIELEITVFLDDGKDFLEYQESITTDKL